MEVCKDVRHSPRRHLLVLSPFPPSASFGIKQETFLLTSKVHRPALNVMIGAVDIVGMPFGVLGI